MHEYPYGSLDNGKVLLLLYGGYHSNCNITMSMLERIEVKRNDITFIKVNTSKFYKIKERFSVNSLPAIVYLINGNLEFKIAGSINYKTILNMIERSD